MRCFACDSDSAENFDGLTGRFYCTPCQIVINDLLYYGSPDEIEEVVLDADEEDSLDTQDLSGL